jgi:hypothetical protein
MQLNDELYSGNIIDGLAMSDQKKPHPATWDRRHVGCSAACHDLFVGGRRKSLGRRISINLEKKVH